MLETRNATDQKRHEGAHISRAMGTKANLQTVQSYPFYSEGSPPVFSRPYSRKAQTGLQLLVHREPRQRVLWLMKTKALEGSLVS